MRGKTIFWLTWPYSEKKSLFSFGQLCAMSVSFNALKKHIRIGHVCIECRHMNAQQDDFLMDYFFFNMVNLNFSPQFILGNGLSYNEIGNRK